MGLFRWCGTLGCDLVPGVRDFSAGDGARGLAYEESALGRFMSGALMAAGLRCCICETASVVFAPRSARLSAALVCVLAVSGVLRSESEGCPTGRGFCTGERK